MSNELTIRLPYHGQKPLALKNQLLIALDEKVRIAISTKKLKLCLLSAKSKVPPVLTSHVVYSINCTSCPGSYVGKTERYLETRLKEHKRPLSSVHMHLSTCAGQTTSKVLCKEPNSFKLTIKEAIFIHKLKPTMNSRNEGGCLLSLKLL